MHFEKNKDEFNHELYKNINKGCEYYNRSMKSWLQDNNIEMHSIERVFNTQ